MIIGVDKGTTYTKTNQKFKVKSTIRKISDDEIILYNNHNIIEFNNVKYLIGEKGNYGTDLMKAEHENTKLMVLYAIAKSYQDTYISTDLITGLPIGLYAKNKEKMKQLFQNTKNLIIIDNKQYRINVNDCEVFPESAGVYFSQSQYKNILIIDIGGLSVDISLFTNGKLEKYSTYSMGILKLYNQLINKVNNAYDTSFVEWDAENILKDGVYINGIKMDIKFESIFLQHVLKIIERLKVEYDTKSMKNIVLAGGGGNLLLRYFKKYIPQVFLIDDYFYANAIGYYSVGKAII